MSVLIVDDNQNMRRAIRLVVKDLFEEIYECGDGSQALAAYASQLPDWVFMDIRMKETDGLTATRQIKAAFPDARIIIVTVCHGDDLREAAQEAGAYAYVVKDNLLELRQILSHKGSGQQASSNNESET
jgi:CheY-like chemotaxis protein